MANKYLNKNTKFKCDSGCAVWFKPQNGDFKVSINSAESLLDDCLLSLIGGSRPGQCMRMKDPTTGLPGPCLAPIVRGLWSNKVNVTVRGKKVLSSKCSISCQLGGVIRPFKPTIEKNNVDDNAKSNVAIFIQFNSNDDKNVLNEESNIDSNNENVSANDQTGETVSKSYLNSSEDAKDSSISTQNVEFALCDYKNCDKASECKYLKTSPEIKETNESKNSEELKNNMGKDAFDLYAGDCSEIATSSYGSYMYTVAHHHIVPVNQCFKSFKDVVKLANFYNYDINKAENGICLPTMNPGYDKNSFEERKKIAFNAMKVLGREWHKGGHQYSCKISAKIDSLLDKSFHNYKNSVEAELSIFQRMLNEDYKCRSENYDVQASNFIKKMDHICERIAKKLRKFNDIPEKSYPFFVSKLAFYYAFQNSLSEYEKELFAKDD